MSEDVQNNLSEELARPPVIEPGYTFATITDKISSIVLRRKTSPGWLLGFGISFLIVMLLMYAVSFLLIRGIGIWGVGIPVAWGFAIANFVWWIGIGHAGTLISAILLLLHQRWRTSINRFAEAMTLFAVACAGLFPLLHMGRPWFFYWLLPYPNTMTLWPQFRSPLVWDVFAVFTYFTVSLVFWYIGLIPDLATLRDRAKSKTAWLIYGVLSMGWRGGSRHWRNYETAYLLLAGLATPLVVSVHTVVSFDFAVAIVPGWHSTIFPPYFVSGAIYSGFAMVITLAIPIRAAYGLQDFITMRHLENMAKILLATCLMVTYSYLSEFFFAWYSGDQFEQFMEVNRMRGPYALMFWLLMSCNVIIPQALWLKRVRRSVPMLFIIAIIINVGMWTERYVIVVTSLHRDFMPSAWGMYSGTWWD
ncbi:MAG: hydrogenase, partial [Acidobacteria bacterium]